MTLIVYPNSSVYMELIQNTYVNVKHTAQVVSVKDYPLSRTVQLQAFLEHSSCVRKKRLEMFD
jgi:hypothetical protein